MKELYRYEIEYSNTELGIDTDIKLNIYTVLRETDFFYYIDKNEPKHRYFYTPKINKKIGKNVKNTFAYDTKEKAKLNFIKRTESRIGYLNYFKHQCKIALKIIEKPSFNK